MIPNQWYIILESKELKRGRAIRVRRMNETLALWRDKEGKACCIADRCCHRGASMGIGRVVNGMLECPFHGFLYDSSGRVRMVPANGKNHSVPESLKVTGYRTHEAHGFLWIWWGDPALALDTPFFFEGLESFSWTTLRDPWGVHYSRAIENQLDVVHLPFVHKTTIGRGSKTLVHGPVVTLENDILTFYVKNVVDDGVTEPLKPGGIPDYASLPRLQFHYPNVWQNFISDKIRAVAAFVPVDEEHCIVYVRNYQRMVRIPVLREVFNFFARILNLIILRQDKRVVVTQLPKKTALRMDERLIMGDKPIIEYRKRRQELIEKAGHGS